MGSSHHPDLVLLEEDDVNGSELSIVERRLRDVRRAPNSHQYIPLIDLTQDEGRQRDLVQYENQIINELESASRSYPDNRYRAAAPQRGPWVRARLKLPSFRYIQALIKEGTCVEVDQRSQGEYSWQFLHVHAIYADSESNNIVLQGVRFTRTRYLRGLLPRFKNEICALFDINQEDNRPEDEQAAVEIPITQVIRTRALLRTNDAFPSHRFNWSQWGSVNEIEKKAVLVQRWKYLRYWPTAWAMATKKPYSGAVVRLRSAEIEDPRLRVTDDKLRNEFRGGIIRGGSFRDGQAVIPTVDLDLDKAGGVHDAIATAPLGHQHKYTADDFFCGAGGASCGIRRAGFQVRIACDMDDAACKTYAANFPEAVLKRMNMSDLIEESGNSTDHSDIGHYSPPCQVFSPAHTRTGKDDEANVAALFYVGKILKRRRHRITTGEQTFGLLFDRNEEFFNAPVGQYTALGYSFSWNILKFKEYGVPSIRRRLIWIASCPGEALPPFPKPTHAEKGGGLPAPVTLRDVLSRAGRGTQHRDPLHDVYGMLSKARNSTRFPRTPYNDRCQVGTVTTSGSEWAHPSGRRNFTLRELAYIQTFPRRHKFFGTATQISRQIGNAFPPVVVETLYRHLRRWLQEQDRVVPDRNKVQPIPGVAETRAGGRDVIILDPVEDTVVIAHPTRPRSPIIIEGDDEYRKQETLVGSSERNAGIPVEDVILIDGIEDMNMTDAMDNVGDYPSFSRESSRTLSAESLPDLIEMEANKGRETDGRGFAGMYLERRREKAEAHRRDLFRRH